MNGWYFYTVLIAFTFGIGIASVVSLSWPLLLLMLLLALGLALLGRYYEREEGSSIVILSSVLLLVTALGAGRFIFSEQVLSDTMLASRVGEEVTIEGKVVREPDIRTRTTQLTIATDDTRVLVSTDPYTTIAYGDTVRVTGKLELPETFTTDLGRTFDYPGYLRARGVTHTMSFVSPELVTPARVSITSLLLGVKHTFMEALESVLPEPQVGLGEGLLLGVKQSLGEELEESFRIAGLIHIVVLSGYNIMLIVAFVLYVLSFFLPKRAQVIVGIIAIAAFALMVGLGATVLRATIMASLLLLVSLTSRRYLVLRSLFLAGVIMLIFNPYLLLYDIGFQLSFMATLGLILVAPQFEQFTSRVGTAYGLRDFLIATLATQIAVLPLLVYHIGSVSLVAIVANVVVLPMVPIAMMLTFITGIVALTLPTLALPISFLAYYSLSYIMTLASWFASWPLASVTVPMTPWYVVPILYLMISLVVYFFWRRGNLHSILKLQSIKQSDLDTLSQEDEFEMVDIISDNEKGRTAVLPFPPETDTPIFFR